MPETPKTPEPSPPVTAPQQTRPCATVVLCGARGRTCTRHGPIVTHERPNKHDVAVRVFKRAPLIDANDEHTQKKASPPRDSITKRDIRISLTLQEACHLVSWKLEADRFSCLKQLERFAHELDMLTELMLSGCQPMPGCGESPYDGLQGLRVRMGFCVRLAKLLENAGAAP